MLITLELSILDIKVRNYLNISSFNSHPREIGIEMDLIKNKIPFLRMNANTLVTDYIIKTIDGELIHPIISLRRLKYKSNIHRELFDYYLTLKKRILIKQLRKQYLIPKELITMVLKYANIKLIF
jgi:hypothetical protein